MSKLGNRFLRIAVIYFVAGVLLGIAMAVHQIFTLAPVHGAASLTVGIAVLCFAVNLWQTTR